MRVGVMGCGVISRAYVENAGAFDSYEIVACADLDRAQATALGKASGLAVVSVDELIADPAIDVILNLTPPLVHAAVTREALTAGKHVYTEKPLATDAAEKVAVPELAAALAHISTSPGPGLDVLCHHHPYLAN
jgi:predicted dehydrogenase